MSTKNGLDTKAKSKWLDGLLEVVRNMNEEDRLEFIEAILYLNSIDPYLS